MKNYKTLIAELSEAMWPGTPEYKKKFGETPSDSGSRHNIERSSGVVRATRKYEPGSGESEEPTKNREDAAAAPVKRGRGRPPGKYGSYKKKVKESIEILEALETDEEIEEFIYSLDEESFAELEDYLSVDEAEDWGSMSKRQFKRREMEHELGDEVEPKRAATSDSPHAVHINGKKWKTFGSKSHATNVAKKIKGASVVKESLDEEQLDEISWQTAQAASNKSAAKVMASKTPEEREKNVAQMKSLHKGAMSRINATSDTKKGPSGYQRSTAGRLGEEEVDEAMSAQAKTTMKHVKNATPGEKKAAKDIKPGIAGYRDRVAMLQSAAARGGLKNEEVEKIEELSKDTLSSYASKAGKRLGGNIASLSKTKEISTMSANPTSPEEVKGRLTKDIAKRTSGLAGAVKRLTSEESEVDEALKHPNHKVLDKNKNNKLDKEDFAILRGEKKAPMKEETTDDSIAQIAAFITKQAKGEV